MNMTILDFIKKCSTKDSPIGDLVIDALRDNNFPISGSEKEIISYLDEETRGKKEVRNAYLDFLVEFQKSKEVNN